MKIVETKAPIPETPDEVERVIEVWREDAQFREDINVGVRKHFSGTDLFGLTLSEKIRKRIRKEKTYVLKRHAAGRSVSSPFMGIAWVESGTLFAKRIGKLLEKEELLVRRALVESLDAAHSCINAATMHEQTHLGILCAEVESLAAARQFHQSYSHARDTNSGAPHAEVESRAAARSL